MKIRIEDLDKEVNSIVREWGNELNESVDEAVRQVATESRKELRTAGSFQNRTGQYRKGWKIKFDKKRYGLEAIIHNKVYRLTHLLESGHAKWLWGRDTGEYVQAFPHIENVNEEAQKRLEEEIIRRIQ